MPKTKHEKAMQRALLQYRNPKFYDLVYEALTEAGRTDLIGDGPKCLIRDKKKVSNGYGKGSNFSKSKDVSQRGNSRKSSYGGKKNSKDSYSKDSHKNSKHTSGNVRDKSFKSNEKKSSSKNNSVRNNKVNKNNSSKRRGR